MTPQFSNAVFLCVVYVIMTFENFLLALLHNFTVLANEPLESLAATTEKSQIQKAQVTHVKLNTNQAELQCV